MQDRTAGVYVGVDPGVSGAVAFYNPFTGTFSVFDMPTKTVVLRNKKRRHVINCVALGRLLDVNTAPHNVFATVEQVNAMPGQGVTSMFSFGRAAGVIDGQLGALGVDPLYVLPRVWQKAAGIPAGSDKDGHRKYASFAWPEHARLFERKRDDGRADASLILLYGMEQWPKNAP